MKRPYVICHILSSLDGKINGPFMGTESVGALGAEYGKFRTKMNADAWLYGTTTTKEFTDFRKPVLEESREVPEGDYIADNQAELYYISVDTDGEIGWESGTFSNKGRRPAHVIEVLTKSTSPAYKDYLRKRGVSYIIAGGESLDCKLAMEKLYDLFHIEKVLICGAASLFTQALSFVKGKPVEFVLKDIEKIGDGGLHLTYLPENVERNVLP